MHISEFDFELPPELIAQQPLEPRDSSRMMIIDRARASWRDGQFAEIPQLLDDGDLLVINNTRVFPARLLGRRIVPGQAGASVEVLLVERLDAERNLWRTLSRPGRALRVGSEVEFGGGRLRGVVREIDEEGHRLIEFSCAEEFVAVVDEIGNTPLPPYIKRDADELHRLDEPRYQTIYARERGAIAAPTAGMHFTTRIFAALEACGVAVAEITHHVGYATFQPVRVDQIEAHRIAAESYEISAAAAATINRVKQSGRRVIAVGTTSVRALESAAGADGLVKEGRGRTELFIYPGYKFRAVDGLLTNFHLPQSSLLMLVAAFAGHELILNAYRHAIAARYRFYSYGDCMLLL